MTLIIRTISALLVFGTIFGAYPSAQSTGATNTLTAAEKSAGWILLFDGTSMNQWRGYKKPDVSGLRWKAEDGCRPAAGRRRRHARATGHHHNPAVRRFRSHV